MGKQKFQVGDTVVILSSGCCDDCTKALKGKVAVIKKIGNIARRMVYYADTPGVEEGIGLGFYRSSNLELYMDDSPVTPELDPIDYSKWQSIYTASAKK